MSNLKLLVKNYKKRNKTGMIVLKPLVTSKTSKRSENLIGAGVLKKLVIVMKPKQSDENLPRAFSNH